MNAVLKPSEATMPDPESGDLVRCEHLTKRYGETVAVGQHDIEHDQIERMSCALSVHLCGTFGDRGSHAVPFEIA